MSLRRARPKQRVACWKPDFFWVSRESWPDSPGQLLLAFLRSNLAVSLRAHRRTKKVFEFTGVVIRHKTDGALCPPARIRFATSMNILPLAKKPALRTFILV